MIVELSIDAARQVRESLDRYEGGIEPGLLDDLRLASSELVSNAVLHSGRPQGDPIEFRFNILPGKLRVQVLDHGIGAPDLHPRAPESGLGMVDIISDRWSSDMDGSFYVWLEIDTEPILITRAA
jgi:anti-sigma regulatory factor (Ser/Thr protein kinase)